jgi:transcriptional regulator with XRE-family HTH domain
MLAIRSEQHVGELVRELRERRRLSVRTLAAEAGFSPSFISQVENGQASPSIASLERIAAALGVTLVEFFQASEARTSTVVRGAKRPRLESGWSKAKIEALGVEHSKLEPVMITLAPGGSSGKRAHANSREEFALVSLGTVTLFLDGDEQVLERGDSVTISPQRPRRWVNHTSEAAEVLVVAVRFP